MKCTIKRFNHNPIFRPEDIPPSQSGLKVEGVLNPGVFRFQDRIGLLMRVAERPICDSDHIATLVLDKTHSDITPKVFSRNDPKFSQVDPRAFFYDGKVFLTTMSHLLIAWSFDGGKTFKIDHEARIFPRGEMEAFGIEDCRVEIIDNIWRLTYTAVSQWGIATGYTTTSDWQNFSQPKLILPPSNKDCALFSKKINGRYYCLHRPSAGDPGGNNIWMMSSPDLIHWGDQRMVIPVRPFSWDEQRIGAGAAPIETEVGWLEIYHGADNQGRYCLGAVLFDLNEPWKVVARSVEPIMEPEAEYEQNGFYGQCIFTNGHIVDGDRLTLYYGASDYVICGAELSIREILNSLMESPENIPLPCPVEESVV